MKKILTILAVLSICSSAYALSFFDIQEPLCDMSSPKGMKTLSKDKFAITSECVGGVASTSYAVSSVSVDRVAFYKQLNHYKTYGVACAAKDMGSQEEVLRGITFKRTCGMVGAYPTYFINSKQVMSYDAFGSAILLAGLANSAGELIDMSKVGPVCATATTTVKTYGDKTFRAVCRGGSPFVYTINNATTTYGMYIKEELAAASLLCEFGAVSTTTYTFASHVLTRVCGGREGVGEMRIDGVAVTFGSMSEVYSSLKEKENPKVHTDVRSASSTSLSTVVGGGLVNVPSCIIPTKAFKALSLGSSGKNVTTLQKNLVSMGYLNATPNGYYGKMTKAAVINFQKANKITATGVVGSATVSALNRVCK